jgi:hypothetical protein
MIERLLLSVMPGLDPGIQACPLADAPSVEEAWIAGSSPAMTEKERAAWWGRNGGQNY